MMPTSPQEWHAENKPPIPAPHIHNTQTIISFSKRQNYLKLLEVPLLKPKLVFLKRCPEEEGVVLHHPVLRSTHYALIR